MKKFDEVTHLELMLTVDKNVVGYLDLYGYERWSELTDAYIYKGNPVLIMVQPYSDDDTAYGVLKIWDFYSQRIYRDMYSDIDGILCFCIPTTSGESRGWRSFNKFWLPIEDGFSHSVKQNLTNFLDYSRIRFKRYLKSFL